MGDTERLRAARMRLLEFRRVLSEAHGMTRNPRVAGDLIRAFQWTDRVRLELDAAENDLTTTSTTTAGG